MPENHYAVDALVKVIRDAEITYADMETAYDVHWAAISSLAEVNIPSEETRADVLTRLKEKA